MGDGHSDFTETSAIFMIWLHWNTVWSDLRQQNLDTSHRKISSWAIRRHGIISNPW